MKTIDHKGYYELIRQHIDQFPPMIGICHSDNLVHMRMIRDMERILFFAGSCKYEVSKTGAGDTLLKFYPNHYNERS